MSAFALAIWMRVCIIVHLFQEFGEGVLSIAAKQEQRQSTRQEQMYKTGTKTIYKTRPKTFQHPHDSPNRVHISAPLLHQVVDLPLIVLFIAAVAVVVGRCLAWPMRVANTYFLKQMGGSSFKTNEGRKYIFK